MAEIGILNCDKEKGAHRTQQGLDSGHKEALSEEGTLKLSEGRGTGVEKTIGTEAESLWHGCSVPGDFGGEKTPEWLE